MSELYYQYQPQRFELKRYLGPGKVGGYIFEVVTGRVDGGYTCGDTTEQMAVIPQKEYMEMLNRHAQPNNEPLTLHALTSLEPGSPVLLSTPDKKIMEWKIIKNFDYENGRNGIKYTDGQYSFLGSYKVGWLAYRTKPERSE